MVTETNFITSTSTLEIKGDDKVLQPMTVKTDVTQIINVLGTFQELASYCFYDYPKLRELNLPDTIEVFNDNMIHECPLETLTIPKNLREIYSYGSFDTSFYLTTFLVSDGNTHFCAQNGVLFTYDKKTLMCYPGGKNAKTYYIPDGTKEIFSFAFAGSNNLETIVVPPSVSIIQQAFCYRIYSIKSIIINQCSNLIHIDLTNACSGTTYQSNPQSIINYNPYKCYFQQKTCDTTKRYTSICFIYMTIFIS